MKKIVTIISMVCLTWVPLHAQQSAKKLIKQAKRGNNIAQYNLGISYRDGYKGLSQDDKKAFYWFEKSAKNGLVLAYTALGYMYDTGRGTTENVQKAEYWWKKGVDKGNKDCVFNLGNLYTTDRLPNYEEGIKLLSILANEGNKGAMNNLGIAYNDLGQNESALMWLSKGAKAGYHHSELTLGAFYLNGHNGFPIDYEKSIYWNKRAAEAGISEAKHNIPIAQYKQGDELYQQKRYEEAIALFLKAASDENNPNPEAMRKLSACFRYGLGVPIDPIQEKHYMEEAAKLNDEVAMRVLSIEKRL